MKRNIQTIGSVMLGIAMVAFTAYACRKNEKATISKAARETLLFNDETDKSAYTAGQLFLGGNVKRVTSIDYDHPLLGALRWSEEWKKATRGLSLDLGNITRTYVHNTSVSLVTIPVRTEGKTKDYFNIYIQGEQILLTKLSENRTDRGLTGYEIRSAGGELYYRFDLDKGNRVGNWKFGRDMPKIFRSTAELPAAQPTGRTGEVCSKKKFYSCMNCLIIDVCGADWLCTIACGLAVPSCVGGAALVCLVAN